MDEGEATGLGVVPSDSDSTQVLVSVNQFPEESMARLPATPSFAANHTMAIESTLEGGLEMHRNMAESRLEVIDVDTPAGTGGTTTAAAGPTNDKAKGGQAAGWAGVGGRETLIDEMSSAVADANLDGMSMASLEVLYSKFADMAKAVGNNRTCTGQGATGSGSRKQPGAKPTLPPEVQERVLKTLSEVKIQLDNVRNQLMNDK